MNSKDIEKLPVEQQELYYKLQGLRDQLDLLCFEKYHRINPFSENLLDWREKGKKYGGNNVVLYDSSTLIGDVSIGENVYIGPGSMLDGSGGLKIGNFSGIGQGTQIFTHDTVKYILSSGKIPYERAPVVIENNVFVASQVIIGKGVTIGHHSVVAANATVFSDVPPFSIVGGTPAKIIGTVHLFDNGDIKLVYSKSDK